MATSFSMHGQTVASADIGITDREISGLTAPVTGEAPVTTFSTTEYSATVTWSPTITNSIFAGGEFYSATVTLTPVTGKTALNPSRSDCLTFTLANAQVSCMYFGSGVEVTLYVDFASTVASQSDSAISDTTVSGLTAPVAGATALRALPLSANSQYTATVTWSGGNPTTFAGGISYEAKVVLIPEVGFTTLNSSGNACFNGSTSFTVVDSTSVFCVPERISGVDRAVLNVQFPPTAASTDANLSSFNILASGATVAISPTFSSGTTSYTASTNATSIGWGFGFSDPTATIAYYCNSALLNYAATACNLNSGANTFEARVTAEDTTTTKTYSFAITRTPSDSGGSTPQAPATPTVSGVTSTTSTIDLTELAAYAATANVNLDIRLFASTGPTNSSDALQTIQLVSAAPTVTITGLTSGTSYRAAFVNRSNGSILGGGTVIIAFTTSSGESVPAPSEPVLTPEQVAAAAAAQAAAERVAIELALQAAIAKAKLTLHENLQGNKPGTFEEYKAAEYMVNNQRVVAKVNAAVLMLALADRENVEKIAAIIKVENFVDLVSTPATQKYVTSKNLVDLGLIAASNPNKTTVALALKNGNVASLNTIEKIQDAIKAELVSIQARKDRLASIKAKIAARNK